MPNDSEKSAVRSNHKFTEHPPSIRVLPPEKKAATKMATPAAVQTSAPPSTEIGQPKK